jgi:hypothetical protein
VNKPKHTPGPWVVETYHGPLSEVKDRILMQVKDLLADRAARAIVRNPNAETEIMAFYYDIIRDDWPDQQS